MLKYNDHSDITKFNKHALLSASQSSWVNKDDDQVLMQWARGYSQALGTAMHEMAYFHIKHLFKVSKASKKEILLQLLSRYNIPEAAIEIGFDFDLLFENWMIYVNDAIGFRLEPEVPLKYSDIAFGTADAVLPLDSIIKNNIIRIHDYKSGTSPVHASQLLVYDAFLCLEYDLRPGDFKHILCFYQVKKDEDGIFIPTVSTYEPTVDELSHIMDDIKHKSELIMKRILKEE